MCPALIVVAVPGRVSWLRVTDFGNVFPVLITRSVSSDNCPWWAHLAMLLIFQNNRKPLHWWLEMGVGVLWTGRVGWFGMGGGIMYQACQVRFYLSVVMQFNWF